MCLKCLKLFSKCTVCYADVGSRVTLIKSETNGFVGSLLDRRPTQAGVQLIDVAELRRQSYLSETDIESRKAVGR